MGPPAKIDPRYSEGDLVRVVSATNQAEAEFVQGLLLEEGIPSMLRRTRGFDVPDMLAADPREVMVPAAGHAASRDLLLLADILPDDPAVVAPSAHLPARVFTALLGAMRIAPRSGGV